MRFLLAVCAAAILAGACGPATAVSVEPFPLAPSELPAYVYGVCDGPSVQYRATPVAGGSDVVLFEFEAPQRNDPNQCDLGSLYGDPTWLSPDGTVLLHPVEAFEVEATPRSWVARGTDGTVVAFPGLPGRMRPVVWSPDSTSALVPQRPERRPPPLAPEDQPDLPMHGPHETFELLDMESGSVTGGVPSSAGINDLQAWLPDDELIGVLGGHETLSRSVDLATGESETLTFEEYVRTDTTSPDVHRTVATGWNRFAVPEASEICELLRQNDEGYYDDLDSYQTVEATSSCAVPATGVMDGSLVVTVHRPEIGVSGVIGNDMIVLVDPATGDFVQLLESTADEAIYGVTVTTTNELVAEHINRHHHQRTLVVHDSQGKAIRTLHTGANLATMIGVMNSKPAP